MTTDDMASRVSTYPALAQWFQSELESFQASDAKFRVLKSVNPRSPRSPQEPQSPSQGTSPKTLFILDSSFNPPSIAHQYLATSALRREFSTQFPEPYRLLLLFAIMNADKAPSAAAFDQRLTLMTIFAGDLLEYIAQQSSEYPAELSVDIGITKVPYYTDKSEAIAVEGTHWYPDQPKHIHLVGFDTFTRFLNPKYYQNFHPPLSALEPYFSAGHRLRVTLRPDDQYGAVDEQKAYWKRLEDGELEGEGGRREWAGQIELAPPSPSFGVSSTRVRRAATKEDWAEVDEICTPSVAEYLRSEALYAEDDHGAKMA